MQEMWGPRSGMVGLVDCYFWEVNLSWDCLNCGRIDIECVVVGGRGCGLVEIGSCFFFLG